MSRKHDSEARGWPPRPLPASAEDATFEELFESAKSEQSRAPQRPRIPYTLSEITDRLVQCNVPRVQWASVLDQINEKGEAEFIADEYYPGIDQRGRKLKIRISRTPAGYMGNVEMELPRATLGEAALRSWKWLRGVLQKPAAAKPIWFYSLDLPFAPLLIAADDDTAWIGSKYGGLARIGRETHHVEHIRKSTGESGPTCLHVSKRFLWIGSRAGLERLDRVTGEISRFCGDFRPIAAVCESRGFCWAADDRRLAQIDLATGDVRVMDLPEFGVVSSLAAIEGELWCGYDEDTTNLFVLNLASQEWHAIRHAEGYVLALCPLSFLYSPADLCVGTSNGIRMVNRPRRECVPMSPFNFVHGMVHSVIEAGQYLLLATSNGLFGIHIFELIMEMQTADNKDFVRRVIKLLGKGKSVEEAFIENTCIKRLADTYGHVCPAACGTRWGWAVVEGRGVVCISLPAVLGEVPV